MVSDIPEAMRLAPNPVQILPEFDRASEECGRCDVLVTPEGDLIACVEEVPKPTHIQPFVTELTVKTFDVPVLWAFPAEYESCRCLVRHTRPDSAAYLPPGQNRGFSLANAINRSRNTLSSRRLRYLQTRSRNAQLAGVPLAGPKLHSQLLLFGPPYCELSEFFESRTAACPCPG